MNRRRIYREIKTLDLPDQARAISLLKRRGALEDRPEPSWPPPGCLWCGHHENFGKKDENLVEYCTSCEREASKS